MGSLGPALFGVVLGGRDILRKGGMMAMIVKGSMGVFMQILCGGYYEGKTVSR